MKILFLSIIEISTIYEHTIYTDLLRAFINHGHEVNIITPVERRRHVETSLEQSNGVRLLKVKTGNFQKINVIEKGITSLLIGYQYKRAIKKFFKDMQFDLILYSTPPVTFVNAIKYIKKRDNAKTYLMLKDIWPHGMADLGIITNNGPTYAYFRAKEKALYKISDKIGCMSQANVDFILKHNLGIGNDKVEICPNSIEVQDTNISDTRKIEIRQKYCIPHKKTVFVYGGNLGKPQGVDFLIKCLKSQKKNSSVFFLIVGSGTEYFKLEKYIVEENPVNVKLITTLPRDEYDILVASCDVGMIFLDHRITIPNFPSRLLSYMQAHLPVLAMTDPNTDIGKVIVDGKFGWWGESSTTSNFSSIIDFICKTDKEKILKMGLNARTYLESNFTSNITYQTIMNSINAPEKFE